MYKYSKMEMVDKIFVGSKVKICGNYGEFNSIINGNEENLSKYYVIDSRIYKYTQDELTKKITKGKPLTKDLCTTPFFFSNGSIWCYIIRNNVSAECSFDYMYDNEMFDDDGDLFVKKQIDNRKITKFVNKVLENTSVTSLNSIKQSKNTNYHNEYAVEAYTI